MAITTDASFHLPDDGSEWADQYPSLETVISSCNDKNIKVLWLPMSIRLPTTIPRAQNQHWKNEASGS